MTKNSETYLKPCPTPWCPEGTDFLLIDDRFVTCTSCGVKADSVEAWNTRAPVDLDSPSTEVTGTYPEPMTKNSEATPFCAHDWEPVGPQAFPVFRCRKCGLTPSDIATIGSTSDTRAPERWGDIQAHAEGGE